MRSTRPPGARTFTAALAAAGLMATGLVAAGPASAETGAPAPGVDLAFDFGGPSTPVAAGWTGVHPGTAYAADRGYGFLTPPAAGGFRDRGGDDLMRRDFTIGAGQVFAVDVPDGVYEVTTWAGDLIAGNSTSFDIEGTAFAGPRTSSGAVHEQSFAAVAVADGQLTVRVTGGDGRINGIRVQSPLAAPAALAAEVDADAESVALSWDAVAGATGYAILRGAVGGELTEIGRTTTPGYVDTAVELGEGYDYALATVVGERVSRTGERLSVSVSDPSVTAPAVATGLTTAAIERDSITLSWNAADDAVQWKVFRSTRADLPFELVGTAEEATFTDSDVLTTRPYLYQVVAQNAGGSAEASAVHETGIATTLVRQAEYLDRAPVAVSTDAGVYVGWRLLGLDDRDLAFTVSGHALGLRLVEVLRGLFDQRDDVAHAEDAVGDARGVELLQRIDLLARADELDRLAGDGAHRERGAAAGIAVHAGQHDAGDAEAAVEGARGVDRVLAGERIGDEEHLVRVGGGAHVRRLDHQRLVHGHAAGGVEHHHVVAAEAGGLHGAAGDLHGRLAGHDGKRIDADLLA